LDNLLRPRRAGAAAALDALLVALLAAALIFPLFKVKYLDNWGSIESTFIADGRFLAAHWPHPLWQPLWYGGTRFDYIYPPALRYGTAWIARTFHLLPVRGYHMYTALLYALGIAGMYVLARTGTGSRSAGWLAAGTTALVSPSFLLMKLFRDDSVYHVPQRLHVLVGYGEGPHMSALSLIPFVLAAGFIGLRGQRPAAFALAAIGAALVGLNNFYGLIALAMLFPVLAWSVWVTGQDARVWLRAAGIGALAYALTAFWLVPSYFRITLANLSIVSREGNRWSIWVALAAAGAYAWWSLRLARGKRHRAYMVFVCGAAGVFALNVLGNYYLGFRVAGEPLRLVPELDLVLILPAVEGMRWLWRWRPQHPRLTWAPRAITVLIVLAALASARHYVKRAWQLFPPDPKFRERIEYRLTDWIAHNLPGSRVFVSGSTRFWYGAWHDLPQVGGGSEQGLLNPNIMPASWEILINPDPRAGVLWLKALGADAVAVPEKNSQEIFHDFNVPKKFAGALPVLYDDGQGNVIYRVPRRYPALARVVDCARAEALGPVRSNYDLERLAPYVEVIERGPDSPAEMRWEGTDAFRVSAAVSQGQCLLVQVSYDPAWRAYADGREAPVRRDALGQTLVYPPAGTHEVRMVFEMPFENRAGRVVTAGGGLATAFLFFCALRQKKAVE